MCRTRQTAASARAEFCRPPGTPRPPDRRTIPDADWPPAERSLPSRAPLLPLAHLVRLGLLCGVALALEKPFVQVPQRLEEKHQRRHGGKQQQIPQLSDHAEDARIN